MSLWEAILVDADLHEGDEGRVHGKVFPGAKEFEGGMERFRDVSDYDMFGNHDNIIA